MWFRNLIVYRLPAGWEIDADALAAQLAPMAFVPGMALEAASLGWVPPREGDASLVVTVGRQMLIALRQERKLLPPKVVTQFVKERALRIEETEGFKPRGKRLKQLKEDVRDELLPRAFSLASDTRAWIDPVGGWLVVDSASAPRASELLALLVKSVDGLPVRALKVAGSPAGEMTAWLVSGDAPGGFTIDQDVELRARDGKATIRYANQSLEQDDVARHTRAGKQCTKLALTWAGRVSFMLTDKLDLRRVRPLDVLKEAASTDEVDADARFASDFTLMTGELSRLIADVVDALGGDAAESAEQLAARVDVQRNAGQDVERKRQSERHAEVE
jgi:recombination associated protein RdgC